MKLVYTLVLTTLFFSVNLFAQEDIVRSLSLYNLTNEKLNKTHIDSQNQSISVETFEPDNIVSGEQWNTVIYSKSSTADPLVCINETVTESAPYDVITLRGRSTFSIAQSPYILITLPETHDIQDVEVLGRAVGGQSAGSTAELVCAFSSTGIKNSDFKVDPDSWFPELRYEQSVCSDQMKQALLPGTKYIKIIATQSFAGVGLSFDANPMITAINLYSKDTGTGIEFSKQESVDVNLYGRNLQLSELADVVIFNLAGNVVARYNNIDNAYLDALSNGVYVVSAATQTGVKVNRKVVID